MGYIGAGISRFNTADGLSINADGPTVTGIKDEDSMASNSAVKLATQQSIKAYVDSQVGANNELSEVLANGNTTGGNNIAFADNDKAIFGAGSDLQIYHDGLNSYVQENGTGNLRIRANDLSLEKASGGEYYLQATADGALRLYYDAAQKLATTSTGVDVTGGLNTTGNVGIGTTSPFSTLSTSVGHNAPSTSGNMASHGATIHNGSGGRAVQIGVNETGAYNYIQSSYVNNASIGVDLAFFTGASERMRIDSSGSVGIGTTSPTTKLETAGGIGSTGGSVVGSTALPAITMYYDTSNDYGVTTTLHNGTAWKPYVIRSAGMIFKTSSDVEAMRIDSSGNVGIGKSSPSTALDVFGNINASGYVEAGEGSGSVALTVNDGHGNANLTFNHASGVPDVTGSACRIETSVDAAEGNMLFEVADSVTAGVAVSLTEIMKLNRTNVTLYRNSVGNVHTAGSKTGTQTPDLSFYNSFVWTLTGNITLANPTTEITGMSGVFVFIHSGAGRTVSLGTQYRTVGGAGLTLSGAAGAVDLVPYFVRAGGIINLGTPQLGFA
jgi:hypothetical protein